MHPPDVVGVYFGAKHARLFVRMAFVPKATPPTEVTLPLSVEIFLETTHNTFDIMNCLCCVPCCLHVLLIGVVMFEVPKRKVEEKLF